MSSLLLLGAGGHGKVIAESALASGCFTRIAFLDDRVSDPDHLQEHLGWPVIGPLAAFRDIRVLNQFPTAIVAIGNSQLRLHWLQL